MNKQELIDRIQDAGLGSCMDALLNVASSAIHLTTCKPEGNTALGGTRLGGLPDLPPGVAWPMVDGVLLEFVGQLQLAELAPYDVDGLLPKTGMLYFFFDGMLTGYNSGKGQDRRAVLYYDGSLDALERRDTPAHNYGDRFYVYNACPLKPENTWTLPPFEEIGPEDGFFPVITPVLSDGQRNAYRQLRQPLRDFSHRLLGHPDEMQGGEMRFNVVQAHDARGRFAYQDYNYKHRDELSAEMRRWRLLAQFKSDANTDMSWGSGGLIYYWIRSEDLLACRFDRVYGQLVCT